MNLTPKNTIEADTKRERGRPLSLDNYRKIIKALQEKPRSWSELEKETGVPKSSLDRILKFLESLGLIYKDKDMNMWFWYSHKLVLNEKELELFKKHSKELLPGLALLLRNFGVTSISLKKYGFEEHDEKDRVILKKLLECVYKHLETGYPDLYQKIEECFNIIKKMEELFNTITPLELQNSLKTALFSEIPFLSKSDRFDLLVSRVLGLPWEAIARLKYKTEIAKLVELNERLKSLLKEIYAELNLLMIQIEKREEPILGKCPKCPRVVIQISIEKE